MSPISNARGLALSQPLPFNEETFKPLEQVEDKVNVRQINLSNQVKIESLIDLSESKRLDVAFELRDKEESIVRISLNPANGMCPSTSKMGLNLPVSGLRGLKLEPTLIGDFEGRVYFEAQGRLANKGIFLRYSEPIGTYVDGRKPSTILSGICLFGSTGLAVETEGKILSLTDSKTKIGSEISRVFISPDLSLYEVESVYRQAAVINETIKLNPELNRIVFQIPNEDYMLYSLGLKLTGLLSKADYIRLCEGINDRASKIEEMFRGLISKNVDLQMFRVFNPIRDLIRDGNFSSEAEAIAIIEEQLKKAYPSEALIIDAMPKTKELNKMIYRGEAISYLYGMNQDPSKCAVAVESFAMETLARSLANRKPAKVIQNMGLGFEALYSYESIIPVVGEMSLAVGSSPVSCSGFSAGMGMASLPIFKKVPKVGLLYFSGIQSNPHLSALIKEQFDLGGGQNEKSL